MTTPAETPTSVEERVRTSVSLAELRVEVAELRTIAEASDGRLAELVTLGRARDAREAAAEARAADLHTLELLERRARGAWLRGLIPARLVERAAIALGSGILAAAGIRAAGTTEAPEPPAHVAGPPPAPFDP